MKKIKISDTIAPEIKFSLVEDSTEVDGVNVLAKVRGQFFVPNGKSRNGRFYPKSLWEKVISDPKIQETISKKLMFGTVGHDVELNDKAVREGLVSHFMIKILINESNKGMGEALILNTPTGRILNTVLRAGSELSVSSRANGTFKGKKGDLDIVDEDTYEIDGWDFVIDPGFLEANPSIAESLDSNLKKLEVNKINKNTNIREVSMDAKLVEHIANENSELKTKVGNLTDEVTTLEEGKQTLTDDNTHLKNELGKWEEDKKVIEKYNELGTVEEIKEKLEKADADLKVLEAYNELADGPEDAKVIMEKAKDFVSTVKDEFGTIDKIREALTEAISFRESVDELGSLDQIKEALDSYLVILEAKEEKELDEKIKALATELNIEEEKVKELLNKYSEEDVRALHTVVAKKETTNENHSELTKKNFEEDGSNNSEISEGESRILGKSRIERISERFSK